MRCATLSHVVGSVVPAGASAVTYYGRAAEDPTILNHIATILERDWDPESVIQQASGDATFYRGQAAIIAGMLAADARETEVQGYLRRLELAAGPRTLHPAEIRHGIAVALWRAARSL